MKKTLIVSAATMLILTACSSEQLEATIPTSSQQENISEFIANESAIPLNPWTEDDPTWGKPDAPIKIVVFSDLQCPYCARFVQTLNTLESDWIDTGKLAIQYREFPIKSHKNSLTAAQAVGAAHLQGKFWEMHNKLYQTQDAWAPSEDAFPIFESYAQNINLNISQFKKDYYSSAVAQEAIDDMESGQEAGVKGTPTWFLNGIIFKGNLLEDSMNELLKKTMEAISE